MTESEAEKRSEEIADAAELYLENRWQRLATVFLRILPDLLAVVGVSVLLTLLMPLAIGIPLWGLSANALGVLSAVLTAALICYAMSRRWLMNRLGSLSRQQSMTVVRRHVRPARHFWLWFVVALYPGLSGMLGEHFLRVRRAEDPAAGRNSVARRVHGSYHSGSQIHFRPPTSPLPLVWRRGPSAVGTRRLLRTAHASLLARHRR